MKFIEPICAMRDYWDCTFMDYANEYFSFFLMLVVIVMIIFAIWVGISIIKHKEEDEE